MHFSGGHLQAPRQIFPWLTYNRGFMLHYGHEASYTICSR